MLRQRGKNEFKSNANRTICTYLFRMQKGVSSVDDQIKKEMTIINWGALFYNFGTSDLNHKVTQNFGVSPDDKTRSNLKLIKDKVL